MIQSIAHHITVPARAGIGARRIGSPFVAARHNVGQDRRWPAIVAALAQLRFAGRYSVRIVDADCGNGDLLLMAVRQARMLGFTAIEGHGIDGVPALVAQARSAALGLRDPAIGVTFEMADMLTALQDEADFPADILVWHGGHADRETAESAQAESVRAGLIAAAGRIVIDDSIAARAPGLAVAA